MKYTFGDALGAVGVRCSAELARANSTTKCNTASTKEERSGTLTKSSAKKGSSDALSPDHPRGEVYVGDVAKANATAVERRDGATTRSSPQHDHARVPSQLRALRWRVSA